MESLLQDVRYGARMLRRSPVFTLVVIMTLALVALAAGYLPARRVLRVDPMVALRDE